MCDASFPCSSGDAYSGGGGEVVKNVVASRGLREQESGLENEVIAVATKALKDAMENTYKTRDAAAKAWAAIVQPLADRFNTEIGSKLFTMDGNPSGKTKIGSPTSDGILCSLNAGCEVNVRLGGNVPGGMLSGYIHTHPYNDNFSADDIYAAYELSRHSFVENDFSAYVTLSNGHVYRWSTDEMRKNYQPTYQAHVDKKTYIRVQ
ncbi:hypothetical protein HF690_12420 [Oleiagrimonas citrea]|uniref:Uncharacterized protein n=1 Tax=Oleiagrimonas citrea TaxID=1665687 RepID=A0A846ZPD8_9GAMM|nr:hypothetical protein [Oleiagrimonas citrea]NKZ39752.1 hypothetical protein [Oleiagrimonas citrea]